MYLKALEIQGSGGKGQHFLSISDLINIQIIDFTPVLHQLKTEPDITVQFHKI